MYLKRHHALGLHVRAVVGADVQVAASVEPEQVSIAFRVKIGQRASQYQMREAKN